jgi:hypothetical protein
MVGTAVKALRTNIRVCAICGQPVDISRKDARQGISGWVRGDAASNEDGTLPLSELKMAQFSHSWAHAECVKGAIDQR